ncbi:MAG TPA: trypsin-like peptidase domain-containing protein [Bacteroidales bacterium]|nr:trypsin-like peptidase domain-containing protein [Bacteroidales bacterium]
MKKLMKKWVFVFSITMVSAGIQAQVPAIDFTKAAEHTVNAVVHIQCEFSQQNNFYSDFFWFLAPQPSSRKIQTSGSGVIIKSDGYIITNNHVVQDAETISVILNDRRIYTAEIIGNDPEADIAVIKINETELPTIDFGNSDETKIGQWVLAVGNPFNLTSTVTAGIISAKARNLNILGKNMTENPLEFYIQTDAAVNRGNSGGALVDLEGKLIGINTAIASNTGSYAGYSFAIPSNIVKKITNDLINYGITQKAYLGVNIAEVDAKLAENIGVKKVKGLYIATVVKDGAAYKAGMHDGDIIMKINNKTINTLPELNEIMAQSSPNEKVHIVYEREGVLRETEAILLNENGNTNVIKPEKKPLISVLNAQFRELTEREKKTYGVTSGYVLEKATHSPLQRAGIKPGYVITSIGGKEDITYNTLLGLDLMKGRVIIEGFYPTDSRLSYYIIVL